MQGNFLISYKNYVLIIKEEFVLLVRKEEPDMIYFFLDSVRCPDQDPDIISTK